MRQRRELKDCGLTFLPQGSQISASRYLMEEVPAGTGTAGHSAGSLIMPGHACSAPPPEEANGEEIVWEYPASQLGK